MKQDILFIQESMSGGGAEKVLSTILKHLDLEKFNVTLLLLYGNGPYMKAIPKEIETYWLFPSYQHFAGRVITHFGRIRNFTRKHLALKKLKEKKFDTVISFMEGPSLKLHSQIMNLGKKHCTWIHCNQKTHRWYGKWLSLKEEKDIYRRMDCIAVVSNGVNEAFTQMFDTTAKLQVIHNPVEIDKTNLSSIKKNNSDHNTLRILNIGRLVEAKRQDRLLEAARILKSTGLDFHIDILGSGPLENNLKELSKSLNVADVVKFHGFIENPVHYFLASDIFCLSSDTEGYPMVVGEALSLGIPVVSTKVNGVEEMLANGGGILTEKSPEDIAAALKTLIENPRKLNELKEEAAKISGDFNIESSIKIIEQFISA